MKIYPRLVGPDEFEPNDEPSQANWIEIGIPQQHNFHTGEDVDWVKFQVNKPGRYTIRVGGVVSNRLDTVIELFDANLDLIAENDDGGDEFDSRLSLHLDSGLYYLKAYCFHSDLDQPYTISVVRKDGTEKAAYFSSNDSLFSMIYGHVSKIRNIKRNIINSL